MNRDIIFRAWHKLDSLMIYEGHNDFEGGSNLFADKKLMFGLGDSAEIMQYTGMIDKKGKAIFEGDIIGEGRNADVVIFRSGTFSIYGQPLGWCVEDYDETPEEMNTDLWAVVTGNIYQHPELMNDSKHKITEPKSISYEEAAAFGDPVALGESPALEKIETGGLNKSLSTLERLQKEHFPLK